MTNAPAQVFSSASAFQMYAKAALERHSDQVALEWRTSAGATDALRPEVLRYAPRVDIGVGPFNVTPGPKQMDREMIPPGLRGWFEGLDANENPRCLIAIEVVFSGSAKHVLGDILNASTLGLFGLLVCSEDLIARVRRNLEYLKQLANVGKVPPLFRNVRVVSVAEFVGQLEGYSEG